MQDISFLWNLTLITAFKPPQLNSILNQLTPVSSYTPMFPPKYSKYTINKTRNHQVRNGNNITFTGKDFCPNLFSTLFLYKETRSKLVLMILCVNIDICNKQ